MADTMHLLKSQIFKLTPFFSAVVIYFAFVHNPNGELWTTVLKCLPIVMLMLYVVAKGLALTPAYKYSQRILLGLICSCIGDALLNINLFLHGMGAFAIGHIWYISAFGWKPLKLQIGVALYICLVAVVSLALHRLDPILAIGVPLYAILLVTTCWRALARAIHDSNILNTLCAAGAVLFLLSDLVIAFNMFFATVPFSRLIIMSTYYTAQFGIAISTAKDIPEFSKAIDSGRPTHKGPGVKTIKD